jgi:hypothetical protein
MTRRHTSHSSAHASATSDAPEARSARERASETETRKTGCPLPVAKTMGPGRSASLRIRWGAIYPPQREHNRRFKTAIWTRQGVQPLYGPPPTVHHLRDASFAPVVGHEDAWWGEPKTERSRSVHDRPAIFDSNPDWICQLESSSGIAREPQDLSCYLRLSRISRSRCPRPAGLSPIPTLLGFFCSA